MTNLLLSKIESTKSFLELLGMNDEAHFHLDNQVNSKSNLYWGTQRPTDMAENPLHSAKVTV